VKAECISYLHIIRKLLIEASGSRRNRAAAMKVQRTKRKLSKPDELELWIAHDSRI